MDSLFDEVSRVLAQPRPRRNSLRILVSTVAGAAVGTLLPGSQALAWNDCPGGCPEGFTCCGGQCCATISPSIDQLPTQTCCNNGGVQQCIPSPKPCGPCAVGVCDPVKRVCVPPPPPPPPPPA